LKLFIDTGPFVARLLPTDPDHERSLGVFREISERKLAYTALYTSNYVVDEAVTRLLYESGHRAAMEALRLLRGSVLLRIVHVTEEDEKRTDEVFAKYDDQRISYTDCTCKVVMDRLGIETAFTFDEDDFETLGITVIP